jgi:uncharacterized protein YdaU (DUF1376 family)
MAPEKSPAFQFYPKEFLTDGNVAGMSLQERGAYITLLCVCWQERSLPADPTRLANMVGLPYAQFRKFWPAIAVCFSQADGRLVHPRLEKEREKQENYRRRQSDKGKASAANRKPTKKQPEGNRGSTGVQPDTQPDTQPEANSPISYLRSPNSSEPTVPHTHARATRLFGKEHREHASCGRACVPAFLHRSFVAALGGNEDEADKRLRDWYLVIEQSFGDEPVPSDVLKFWRALFDAEFVKTKPGQTGPKGFKSQAEADAWVADQKAAGNW